MSRGKIIKRRVNIESSIKGSIKREKSSNRPMKRV